MRRLILAFIATFMMSFAARAGGNQLCFAIGANDQTCYPQVVLIDPATGQPYKSSGGASGGSGTTNVNTAPTPFANGYAPFVVGLSTVHILNSNSSRLYLDLKSNSKTATISCDLNGGANPIVGTTFDIAPGADKTWEGSAVPSGAIDCVASAAGSNLYVGTK